MNHEEIKQLISQEHDGEATPVVIDLIEKHVKDCQDCFKYRESLRKMSTVLKSWDDEELSPDAERKIRTTIQGVASFKEDKGMKPKNRLIKYGFGGGVLLSAVLAIVFMQNYSQRAMQARVKDASQYLSVMSVDDRLASGTSGMADMAGRLATSSGPKGRSSEGVTLLEAGKLEGKKGDRVQLAKNKPYEPYYLETNYVVERKSKEKSFTDAEESRPRTQIAAVVATDYVASRPAMKTRSVNSDVTRASGGMQASSYDSNVGQGQVMNGMVVSNEFEFWGGGGDGSIAPKPNYRIDSDFNTEEYGRIYENEFMTVSENPLSTFSIDVDTASYANMRRYLTNNQMPPKDSVRIEEMINYFNYDYPEPAKEDPFSITTRASFAPWNKKHQLVQIGLQGKSLNAEEIPPSNLVFLIDVSGSMNQPNKLSLLKMAFKMMVNQLTATEQVAIVVYAGAAGKVLESTPGDDKHAIISAIDRLNAGGSTAGGAGIELAYKIAKENFIRGGNNRVILATDGDFNIGVSNAGALTRLIEEKREDGVFLTVLGFGMGNYKGGRMEELSNKGNGNYYYIDNQREAKKVLVEELGSTLFAIAKDVKIQIEFNPAQVKAYRLIGYENRMLAKEDFNDDKKDAGELGAGHTVTALYEIVPADSAEVFRGVDELKYQKVSSVESNDLMTVKLRYKKPDENTSKLITKTINAVEITTEPKGEFAFVAAVAEFGLLLRKSEFKAQASYAHVLQAAGNAKGADKFGYRKEFIDLVEKAEVIDAQTSPGIHFKGTRPKQVPIGVSTAM